MEIILKIWTIGFLLFGCQSNTSNGSAKDYESGNLEINKITSHVYLHTSWLKTQDFGNVPCNGMIVFDDGEAVVFDTPANDKASEELIDWTEKSLHCKIKAVIPTHFHVDCLGGLEAFHKHGVPSYANDKTITLAKMNNFTVPQHGFDNFLELKVGTRKVLCQFMGEGHTEDNVIGYFPSEDVMFGGCLIKELNAGKGNLADANVDAWPGTVRKLKARFPGVKTVIPGHGKIGGADLLDYTIALFEK